VGLEGLEQFVAGVGGAESGDSAGGFGEAFGLGADDEVNVVFGLAVGEDDVGGEEVEYHRRKPLLRGWKREASHCLPGGSPLFESIVALL
jgi:hypothetical protein